jgi:hypothetical protein
LVMTSMTIVDKPASERRAHIIRQYAGWTALSALRSGSPVKSRKRIYPALKAVDWPTLFDRDLDPISAREFANWHRRETKALGERFEGELPVGWVVKLLNVYLKTSVYIGGLGRPGLRPLLHPPIDGGLWEGLAGRFGPDSPICRQTHAVTQIKLITSYETYLGIVAGCRAAAEQTGRELIEVEEWWAGAGEEA